MAKKTEASKRALDKAPERLKEEAQELIAEALDAAAAREPGDSQHHAEKLLSQLEPMVCQYAPPPDRIIRILEDKGIKPAATVDIDRLPEQKPVKLTKDVYADSKGERLARKKRKGWKKVTY